MAIKEKKVKKSAQKTTGPVNETRQAMMLKAKECGVKNFRVLNRVELAQVLAEGVSQEKIGEVAARAVARWKAGWGTKGKKKS